MLRDLPVEMGRTRGFDLYDMVGDPHTQTEDYESSRGRFKKRCLALRETLKRATRKQPENTDSWENAEGTP